MKQHRFDKNFQAITEAVNDVIHSPINESKGKMNEASKLSKDTIKDIEALYKKTPIKKAVESSHMQKLLNKRFGDFVYVVHKHFSPEWERDDMGGATKFKGLKVR